MTFIPRNTSRAPMEEDAAHRLAVLGRAPELVGVDPWFNTADGEPLRIAALRDRVVLLEFWTFACVNCQRTIAFLRRMHDQYQPDATSRGARRITLLHRRALRETMSGYLIRDLERYGPFAIGERSLSCTARMASSRRSHSGAASACARAAVTPPARNRRSLRRRSVGRPVGRSGGVGSQVASDRVEIDQCGGPG